MTSVSRPPRSVVNVSLRHLLQGILLALLAITVPADAREIREERADFNIFLLGLNVATLVIASRNDGEQYAVTTSFGSRGLASLLLPTRYNIRTRGYLQANRFLPTRYIEERKTGNQIITRTLTFQNGAIASVVYDPADLAEQEFAKESSPGPSHELINTLYTIVRDRKENQLCREPSVTFNGTPLTR